MNPNRVDACFALLLGLMGAWLIWAVFQVNIEYADGYSTLTNARFHLGQSEHFFPNRPPLMALLLVPAEIVRYALGLHPMDVRVAHAFTAFLIFAYLLGTWLFLVRLYGRTVVTLLAYVGAIVTPVFFSYAPFLIPDIFPGLLALVMLYLADVQLRSPTRSRWWTMVALGAILALLKQTYALVWIGIVVVVPLWLFVSKAGRQQWRSALGLLLAASVSGAITWLGYAWTLAPNLGSEPMLLRPWLQMTLISANYAAEGGAWQAFYPWVYLQNLWAYGVLAMVLVLPGLLLALKNGSSFERLVASFWIFLAFALHLTPYKEVRYLAVLAPFNAVLSIAVLRWIQRERPLYRWAVMLLAILSVGLATEEAARIRHPYYAHAIPDFLEPLPKAETFSDRVIIGAPLSFVSPEAQAYFGDRYHRITHLTLNPIVSSYGYRTGHFLQLDNVLDISADMVRPGDIGLLASGVLARVRPFVRGNRQGLERNFVQVLGLAETIRLQREPGGYRIRGDDPSASYVILSTAKETPPTVSQGQLAEAEAVRLFGWSELPQQAEVMAFRILRRCGWSGCAAAQSDSSNGAAASGKHPP